MLTCSYCGSQCEAGRGGGWSVEADCSIDHCGRLVCEWKAERAFAEASGTKGVRHWELESRRSGGWNEMNGWEVGVRDVSLKRDADRAVARWERRHGGKIGTGRLARWGRRHFRW